MSHVPYEPTIAGTQFPPPYKFPGLKAFGFPLLADLSVLQDLCDDFLAIAPAGKGISFAPIAIAPNDALVVLQVLDYPALIATTPPWDAFGGAPQQEAYFAVPVVRKQGGQPVEIGLFLPFIFVDNATSAFTGREVFGMPKLLAAFQDVRDFPQQPIVVRFEGRKAAGDPFQLRRLLKVAQVPGTIAPPTFGARIGMFFGPLDALFAASPLFGLIDAAHASGSFFGFSSRMLIGATAASSDRYRSIMRCSYETSNVAAGFLPPTTVAFKPLFEFDLKSALGIRTLGGEALALNPFFVSCDMTLAAPVNLWEQ